MHNLTISSSRESHVNAVLRNTFLLLALTMIPTILGAFAGIQMNIGVQLASHPIWFAVLFLGGAFAFFFGIEKNKNNGAGVALLLAFTFFMGLMLSVTLQSILKLPNGASSIAIAAGMTAVIFFSLAGYVTVTKKDFGFMAGFLFVGLIVLLIASIANIFLHIPAMQVALSAAGVLIFSGYILYDVSEVIHGRQINYVIATLQIYLDLYNLFVNLLQFILSVSGDSD